MQNQSVFDTWKTLQAEKESFQSVWKECSEFVYPTVDYLSRYYQKASKGAKRRRTLHDITPETALTIFASSTSTLAANRATTWLNWQSDDSKADEDRAVQEFIDEAQKKVLAVFNNPKTKFYTNFFKSQRIKGALGTSLLIADADEEHVAKFRVATPFEFDFTEDYQGNVENLWLEREYTVEALMNKGEKAGWSLPASLADKKPTDKVKVLRVIKKNKNYDPSKLEFNKVKATDVKYAMYHSEYYLSESKHLMKRSYFHEPRFGIGRWDYLPGCKWGDSPARVALSDIKQLNASERFLSVAEERSINPLLVTSSEARLGKIDLSSGNVISARGRPQDALMPLNINGDLNFPMIRNEQKREAIRTAFFVDVFQTASDINMTATEALIRNQEKLRNLAPNIEAIQADELAPMAEFVLQELIRRGDLVPPKQLVGVDLKIRFVSPIAKAQRLEEANSILQYVQDVAQIAQIQPDVLKNVDFDFVAKELAEIRGVPEKTLHSKEYVEELEEQEQQQAMAQQQLQLAQQAGDASQSLLQAQQLQQQM